MRRRLLIAGAAAVIAAAALSLGNALRGGPGAGATPAPVAGEPVAAGTGSAQATVEHLQAGLRANPRDGHAYALLGVAYEQRARETGDPTYYTKSGEALDRALALAPRDLLATSGLGSLALSRHRSAARHTGFLLRPPSRTGSSATPSSSSAATRPRSARSRRWPA